MQTFLSLHSFFLMPDKHLSRKFVDTKVCFFVLVQSDHVIQELVTAEIMKNIFSPLNSLNPQCTVRSCLS